MDSLSKGMGRTLTILLAGMIFASPLIQGGTPRLATFVLELTFIIIAASALLWKGWAMLSPFPLTRLEIPLYLFLALSAFSLLRAPYYHDAERCFLLIFMYVCLYSVIIRLGGDNPPGMLMAAIGWAACFQAVLALTQAVYGQYYQVRGTFYNPNFLAGFLVIGTGLFLIDFLDPGGRIRRSGPYLTSSRFISGAALLLILTALLWTRSRGGISALIIALVAALFWRFGLRSLLLLAAVVCSLVIIPNPLRDRLTTANLRDVYRYSRLDIWASALKMFKDRPLFGVGLGQYRFFSPRYAFPVEAHWSRYGKIADNPHSEYLNLAAEMGIIGVIVLMIFLVFLGIELRRQWLGRQGKGQAGLCLLLVLSGVFAHALVDFNLHSPPIVLSSLVLIASIGRPDEPADCKSLIVSGKIIRMTALIFLPLYLFLSIRPLLGFYYFLKAGGGKVDLLHEKESLADWGQGEGKPDYKNLRRALFWDGNSAPYRAAMGSLGVKEYESTGEESWLEMAFQEIDRSRALNPNSHNFPSHLADLYTSLYRRGEANKEALRLSEKHLGEALSLAPYNVFIHDKLARLQLDTGEYLGAERIFRRSLDLEPYFLRGRFGRALALEYLSRDAEAAKEYELILALAEEVLAKKPQSGYEKALVDLDLSLVHNRLESLGKKAD